MADRRWLAVVLGAVGCVQQDPPDVVVPRDAMDPGPYGSQTTTATIDLGQRSDGFPGLVQARVVAPEAIEGQVPVVIFHHGEATEVENYFRTASQLATWGFVVVLPQWDLAAGTRTHRALRRDAIAAMDWLQANDLGLDGVEVDTTRFGMGGHGRGGKQALLTAEADDRVAAVFNLDPSDASPEGARLEEYPSTAPELVGQITVPLGHVGTGRGAEGADPCVPAGEGYGPIFDAASPGALQFALPTAGHQDFTDACADGTGGVACNLCPEGDDPANTLRFGRASLIAFFGTHLLDDDGFADWLEGDQPFEVIPDAVRTVRAATP